MNGKFARHSDVEEKGVARVETSAWNVEKTNGLGAYRR